jgi:hypothetical protein
MVRHRERALDLCTNCEDGNVSKERGWEERGGKGRRGKEEQT